MAQTSFTITGTHCASCQILIEEVCRDIPGVINCVVDFKTGNTVIDHAGPLDWQRLQRDVAALGPYRVAPPA